MSLAGNAILKYRWFYVYWSVAMSTDSMTTAIEKIVHCSQSPRGGDHAALPRKAHGSVKRQRGMCQENLVWFPWEGVDKTGWSRLRIDQVEKFQRVLGHRDCPLFQVSGPGEMRWVQSGPECQPHRGGWELWIGWLVMHGSCLYYV